MSFFRNNYKVGVFSCFKNKFSFFFKEGGFKIKCFFFIFKLIWGYYEFCFKELIKCNFN